MALLRRIAKLAAAALALASYVWFAAVRAAPAVKRRKADSRARRAAAAAGRRGSPRTPPAARS